jgi:hypothetical protein
MEMGMEDEVIAKGVDGRNGAKFAIGKTERKAK